jgi:hypothetical protein
MERWIPSWAEANALNDPDAFFAHIDIARRIGG